jgi:anaerobic selenocysteine-containing dehydrogenase
MVYGRLSELIDDELYGRRRSTRQVSSDGSNQYKIAKLERYIMRRISRRLFLKATDALGASAVVGRYFGPSVCSPAEHFGLDFRAFDLTELVEPVNAALAQMEMVVPTVSDVDAHSQCKMLATVKDGWVTAIRGDPEDPESKGELTLRGQHMQEVLYAPDRLQHPLKRVGARGEGQWEQITWDEALTTIANKLNEIKRAYGSEAIDFYYGHYHSGDMSGYLVRLANLIGTPNVTTPNHICHVPRIFLQWVFDFGAVVPPDVAHTNCMIIWGGNPAYTNKPQSIAIGAARERGAKLIIVDPRSTPCTADADIHARLRPGTDGALALGMLNVIIQERLYDEEFVENWTVGFDALASHVAAYPPETVEQITWVPAETIREMARLYATTKPACISPRNALDQSTNAACAIRAINMLMAITGNLDVKGGNVIALPVIMAFNDISLNERLPPEAAAKRLGADKCLFSRIFGMFPSAHTPSLWDAILNDEPYPVKAMFVLAANPLLCATGSTTVEAALKHLDFLAVADMFMTPTAELADIVLPACTFFEKTRFAVYDTHADHYWNAPSRIVLSPRAVEPLYESWSDWKIVCELGRKLGFAEHFPWETEEDAIDYQLEPLGITCDKLRRHPEGVIITVPPLMYQKFSGLFGGIIRSILRLAMFRGYPAMYRKYEGFMKGFFTPSTKVELYSEQLAEYGCDPLPVYREPAESPISRPDLLDEYPLILIAGTKVPMYTHSMMHNIPSLHELFPENLLEINPETAMGLGIGESDMVTVESLRGSIECKATIVNGIDPRVVHLSHGFEESNCNLLTDHAACDPITGSTGLKSLLCKVEKV